MQCSCRCKLSCFRKETLLTYFEEGEEGNLNQGIIWEDATPSHIYMHYSETENMHKSKKQNNFISSWFMSLFAYAIDIWAHLFQHSHSPSLFQWLCFFLFVVSIGAHFLEESLKTFLCWVNICIVSSQMRFIFAW